MQFIIAKLNISPKNFIRQCGYIEIQNPHKNNEVSYARSLDPGRFYPRFHAYFKGDLKQITINLHLDAKKPSYEGSTAHSGEYDGPLIEQEASRIKSISEKFSLDQNLNIPLGFKKEKPWWKKLFS